MDETKEHRERCMIFIFNNLFRVYLSNTLVIM
jgi:hypothetical protein